MPDTEAPIVEPYACSVGMLECTVPAATANPAVREKTIVECPSEKKKPVPSGRFPSCSSFRVVLSIAAMWSASNACRSPNVYASAARPASAG